SGAQRAAAAQIRRHRLLRRRTTGAAVSVALVAERAPRAPQFGGSRFAPRAAGARGLPPSPPSSGSHTPASPSFEFEFPVRIPCSRPVLVLLLIGLLALPSVARAADRADTTVTWFQERRAEGKSLTVIHPQLDLAFDLNSWLSVGAGYEADVVTGATPSIYAAPRPGQSTDTVSAASEFNDVRHSGHASLGFTGNRST